ncbi:MAG: phosphate ABC transporter substrate-binding protein PstS [Clostridia bacterium]
MRRGSLVLLVALLSVLLLVVASCGGNGGEVENDGNGEETEGTDNGESNGEEEEDEDESGGSVSLSTGGASFPFPLYSEWMEAYQDVEPDVDLDYQSIGSGGGIKGILDGTFDFAGSDAPMKDEELDSAPGEILHIPTVMGAVVITYNVPGVDESIRLTSDVISDIFLGEITKWSDDRIAEINEDIDFPDEDIIVVHRSDGSGTTNTFTDYLSKVSEEWESEVGMGKSVEWPVGLGAKGNEGVAGQVGETEGSMGYVELAYAVENDLPYAILKNRDGAWVEPSLETTSAAAAGALADMPEDMRVSITNSPGEDAWPIATFTYLLVYREWEDCEKAEAALDYIWWAISEGDDYATDLLYAPTPDNLKEEIRAKLESITCNGEQVLGESQGNGGEGGQSASLSTGGASFPFPLYSEWMEAYQDVEPDVDLDYQSIGSGGGIKGILDGTFDFAGSDAPMKDEELDSAPGEILHIPTVMGAVVITYNVPGVDESIRLTSDVISDIFLGEITKWSDDRIAEINEDIDFPDEDIIVVHRSDGSGTTNTFTDYLSKVSEEWESEVGMGKSVEWPVGLGAKGNEGVAGQVGETEGSMGYVELAYAVENDLPYAILKNRDGAWVEPSLETTSAAAAGALADMPEDMRVSITNSPGEDAWPIATFTYLLVYREWEDCEKAEAALDYIWWAISEGDDYATDLLYAPTPDNLKEEIRAKLESITCNGKQVFGD